MAANTGRRAVGTANSAVPPLTAPALGEGSFYMNSPTVFVSYSHRDADLVNRVVEDLRSRAVNVWLDEWKLKPGHSCPRSVAGKSLQ
jgi:TIR domain-containing protein